MDACARIRGVPAKSRASVRKEIISENLVQSVKSLLKSRKELCRVVFEDYQKESMCLTEVHFVGLPSLAEGVDIQTQPHAAVSVDLLELLKSLHVHSLKDEEVVLLKDTKKHFETKDGTSQAVCVIRYSPALQRSIGNTVFALLSKYTTGMRYALELHSLQKNVPDTCHREEDDTNQSVSSIEDDFVTALEHLEEEEPAASESSALSYYNQRNQRDVASQTVPSRCAETSGSRNIISSVCRKSSYKPASLIPEVLSMKSSVTTSVSDPGRQSSFYRPCSPQEEHMDLMLTSITSTSVTESEESECSSPSPIIFLDEDGYQRSLKAKLDIPELPVIKDGVEDSDSEVSEFFDSFDQFDELDQNLEDATSASQTQKRKYTQDQSTKFLSVGCSTTAAMNPHKFEHPILPANVRKPTPLKPESPYSDLSEVPDSPRPVRTSGEESGALFSPICSSAFSTLGSCSASEYFWKTDEENTELGKPQDLAALYKTYSDYASNISNEILGSICGSTSPVDMKLDKNLSCVCHMKFKNRHGHLIKLTDFQQMVTVAKPQYKSQQLKDGIQRLATDLVESSLGSAFRDLQKGVSSCTTTLCHLAARLTSSVFQMAFHEIGMRHASVLKERAVNGLASFLVGEAVSGALKEFQFVKKQMFQHTVARFAADLAEELVFEGIMEVCQFSHPPTPSTPSSWSFEQEEKVVQSYATDLSESVLQEAFIELSQADVTFTTQAAISVSLDNIRYVRAESITQATKTCNASPNYFGLQNTVDPLPLAKDIGTVEKALICASGIASCIPVPVAGKVISPIQTCQNSTCLYCTSEMSPKRTRDCGQKSSMVSSEEVSATGRVQLLQVPGQFDPSSSHASNDTNSETEQGVGDESEDYTTSEVTPGTANFQHFSGTMVDLIVNEAYELMSSSKVKKTVEECADYLSKKIVDRIPSVGQLTPRNLYAEHLAESVMKRIVDKVKTKASNTNESGQIQTSTTVDPVIVVEYTKQNAATYDEDSNQLKGKFPEEIPTFAMLPNLNVIDDAGPSITRLTSTLTKAFIEQRESGDVHHIHHAFRDSLGVPGHEVEFSSASRDQNREVLFVEQGNSSGSPGTPPPTPQQPQHVCQEKRIKQFSKKLKGKLANEFSPATPPSTPRNQSDTCLTEVGSETEKADFMLKLMRSLSDEAEGSEEEDEDEEEQEAQSVIQMGSSQTEQRTAVEMGISNTERGTAHYADRLACHILSMATEMATLCLEDGRRPERSESKPLPFSTALVGQFSDQSLNSLRSYADEVAGEVISDVKKMISLNQCRHKAFKRGLDCFSKCQHLGDHEQDFRNERLNNMAEQWSGDLLASVLNFPPCNSLSGLSSKYPSCESVTDEYAGHVIRVLKREGGNSELILDQYASRLAYRSIKLGLTQAARKIKHKWNMRLYSTRRSPHESPNELFRLVNSEQNHEMANGRKVKGSSAGHGHQCVPQLNEEMNSSEYMELLGFAESLAYNITCDVTRKLRSSTVRLPKSLTDSCLYKKSKLEDMAENLIKTPFSCSLLPCTQRNRQYHSTGSLNDCNCSDSVMQVIEHYARKIVDDTLEMTLASANPQSVGDRGKMDRQTYAETLSEATLKSALADKPCRFCSIKDHPYYVGAHCSYATSQQLQEIPRRKQECDSKTDHCCNRIKGCGRGIPRIHIDLEQKVVFAEEMVSWAVEKAKKELSSTSLTADSGIGHDGSSFAESFTTEIMTSVMSNVCQTINVSAPGKESTVSQQLSLSVGDDSTGSWSNLSFEDEHPDESSSFLHLSDSNGNSSSWSSLGLEGDIYEENLSFSPSDSDGTEDKEVEPKDDTDGLLHVGRALLMVNSDVKAHSVDLQLRAALQWIAASHAELPLLQFCQPPEKELVLEMSFVTGLGFPMENMLSGVNLSHHAPAVSPLGIKVIRVYCAYWQRFVSVVKIPWANS
ncbi:A-kinase anchor protein 11-like isoform X2 [Polyodon spathula]|uniref:A-kinase anchor protein 11-like isoform X2 n=1 Tax=Polyodon spathula TaxID=7913 RepID=UPI001B7EEA23|nr:A-kinase anchor protein 11-like isoform X2 [Polyodon spathula]